MDRVQCDLGLHTIQPALARVEQARQVVWGIMTVMAMTLQQLRDASDEDLIKRRTMTSPIASIPA
jgi:hypothetical protein